MKSLNTYNYREELYLKPFSYQVSISDDDKIIKIEEDGDLIAEVSFALDNNVLFLNGKDGLEVAQIELPLAMAAITSQSYDAETKSIDLNILQSNGESIVFSLDVAELVNVYTAGDGIDITDNVISLKIKDSSGTLTVDEEGLDIDLDSLASSEDISNINSEISQLQEEASNFKEYVDASIVSIKEKVSESIDSFTNEVEKLHASDSELEEKLRMESEERISNDSLLTEQIDKVNAIVTEELSVAVDSLRNEIAEEAATREASISDLQEQIGDVKGKLEGSISDVLEQIENEVSEERLIREQVDDELRALIAEESALREQTDAELQEQLGDVRGDLEGSISEEISKIKEEIGDVKGELEGSISEEIAKIKEEIGDVKGELEGSLTDAITSLESKITEETERAINAENALDERISTGSRESDLS